jgi:DNA-binding response OmpR family regulator
MFGKILCVERDVSVRKSRCAILKYSGYDAASASPQVAEIVLRSQKFDLIVISRLSDFDLHRIINLADGADVLVLDELTMPSELLSLVAERLDRQRKA